MTMPIRMTAKIRGRVTEPKAKHYRGLPPELTGRPDLREQMQVPALVAIEEKPDGVFLFRFTEMGAVVGDTWHMNVEEAQHQARYEFGELLSEWKPVPPEVEDVAAFGLGN